jgi:hypothetical protein
MQLDGQTDMTKLIVTFCSFAKIAKNYKYKTIICNKHIKMMVWEHSCISHIKSYYLVKKAVFSW